MHLASEAAALCTITTSKSVNYAHSLLDTVVLHLLLHSFTLIYTSGKCSPV